MNPDGDGRFLPRAARCVALTGLPLTLGASLAQGLAGAVSAALGVGIALANLWITARAVAVLLTGGKGRTRWTLALCFKLLGIAALLFVVLEASWSRGLGLVIGYAALPLGLVLQQLVRPTRLLEPGRD